MSNMSYCRFHNTLMDLRDCEEYVNDFNLSKEENENRIALIKVCRRIANQFEDEDLEEYFEDNDPDGDDEE